MAETNDRLEWKAYARRRARRLAAVIAIMWALYYLGSSSLDAQVGQIGQWRGAIDLPIAGLDMTALPAGPP